MMVRNVLLRTVAGGMTMLAACCLLAVGGGGCGGAGAEAVAPSISSPAELMGQAALLLAAGDIAGAQAKYDEALAADPENAEAAFGAALTRMMRLPESEPSNKVLRSLGQMEFKTANLVGPTGYLNELNEFNKATVSLDAFPGDFFGFVHGNQGEMSSSCSSISVYGQFRSVDGSTVVRIGLSTDGVAIKAGDTLDLADLSSINMCFFGNPLYLGVEKGDQYYFISHSSPSGKVVVKSLGAETGNAVELELQDVVLTDGDQTIVLNGTIADTVTDEDVDPSKYLPFGELKGGKGINHLMGKAADGYTTDQALEDVAGYHPLLDEIVALLVRADRSDDFQFTVPKGLYFGTKDVLLNRIDLKTFLAGMHFFQAGLYLAESWRYPLDLGTLYDAEGNKLFTPEGLVGQLNEFFTLREDHHLDQAQLELTQGFQTLLDAHDLLATITKDGIFEAVPGQEEAYAQLRETVAIAQTSLSEAQIFPYAEPNLTIDLNRFFNHPPDARNVDVDPFVLENGKIKFVEAFFSKMMEGVIDVDLTRTYQHAYTALQRDPFCKGVFDEFTGFFIAGHFYRVGGQD